MISDTVASTVRTPGTASVPGAKHADAFRPDDEHPAPADKCLGGVAVEHVGRPDEVGDETVGRVLVDLAGLADLFDAPVVEHRQPVAQRQRLVLVVGDDDEGDPDFALDRLELDLHLFAQLEIERAEWLVEQQHPRPPDQRARQRHALTLPARQLRRPTRRVVGQPDHVECICGAPPAVGLRHAADLQPVLDVLRDGHVGEQRVLLEHGVDVAAACRQGGDVDAAELDRPGGGLLESGDHAQHRRLAGTRGAEDREQFAVADGKVRTLDGDDFVAAVAEHLPYADQLDLWIINGGSHIRVRLRADRPRGHGPSYEFRRPPQRHRGFRSCVEAFRCRRRAARSVGFQLGEPSRLRRLRVCGFISAMIRRSHDDAVRSYRPSTSPFGGEEALGYCPPENLDTDVTSGVGVKSDAVVVPCGTCQCPGATC